MMDEYIIKGAHRLRMGYTTGSCAAAAAKAAAWMLLGGRKKEDISLTTPKGIPLTLTVQEITMTDQCVTCAIQKDSGDDPDVTNGALVYATVTYANHDGVNIDGGLGVGRVTRRGLDQPVGAAAINSVPRQMIRENVEEVTVLFDYHGGLDVVISIPAGVELAKKTFNPRLGIEGGISVLGTTGIVEPMSERALVDTIRVEVRQRRACGADYVLLTPGNYGMDFIGRSVGLDPACAVQVSNFIGDALDICREEGFRGALLVGHIGKLVKLAGNMMNTHSKYGDCRMEILCAHAGAAGADRILIAEMLQCVSCDDAVRLLKAANLDESVLSSVTRKALYNLRHRAGDTMTVETILFSNEYGILGTSEGVRTLTRYIREGR